MYQPIAPTCAPDTVPVEAVMCVLATNMSVPHVVTTPMREAHTLLACAKLGPVLIAPFALALLHIPGLVQLQMVCPYPKPLVLRLVTPYKSLKI
jgi:hypothetical protein